LFDPVANAAFKLIESSAANLLIYLRLIERLCGLRANFRERTWGEKRRGESGNRWKPSGLGFCRSPQVSAGVPANTRELAQAGNKKPQLRAVGVLLLVEVAGIEPASETLPDCRNYNHASIMGAKAPNFNQAIFSMPARRVIRPMVSATGNRVASQSHG
jgi:hypothetical protein